MKGGHLVENVKELVHEGNVRRIIIKDSDGTTVVRGPRDWVLGSVAAPSMAAIGALVQLAADYSIDVERATPEPAGPGDAPLA